MLIKDMQLRTANEFRRGLLTYPEFHGEMERLEKAASMFPYLVYVDNHFGGTYVYQDELVASVLPGKNGKFRATFFINGDAELTDYYETEDEAIHRALIAICA